MATVLTGIRRPPIHYANEEEHRSILATAVNAALARGGDCLPKDGTESPTAPLPLPVYTIATRPTIGYWGVIAVSDAVAGQRIQAWDVTAGAWVPLG